jgi:hypothetical protein
LYRWAAERELLTPAGAALVFGAGLLTEALDLSARGWSVDALETTASVERRIELYAGFGAREGCRVITSFAQARARYQLVVVTHVLEFIESVKERNDVLAELAHRLRRDGRMLLSLRGWSDVRAARSQIARGDGIVTGLGTWTRGYTVAQARNLLSSARLDVEQTPHANSKTPKQVRLVCRLT